MSQEKSAKAHSKAQFVGLDPDVEDGEARDMVAVAETLTRLRKYFFLVSGWRWE